MKTKVIHITQGFGGLFTYIKQIIQKIDRTKFEIEIFAPENLECRKFCEEQSIQYTVINLERGFHPYYDLLGLLNIYRFLKKSKPDLVHVHSAKAGFLGRIAARFSGVKSIYTPHGISYLSFTGYKRMLFFLLEVFAKNYTDEVLACSKSEKNRCLYEVGIAESKLTIINNAIEVKDTPILLKNTKKMHIGLVARLTYQKNPLLFVEIINRVKQQYPEARFSILGAGLHDHLKKEFLQKIEFYNLKDSFKIYDWGSFTSVDEYLRTLDVFLMPSVFEGLPFSLLEAMNENVLCVTSRCDGCTDVIDNNENGFSCMDLETYVNSIMKVIENPETVYNLKIRAKKNLEDKFNLKIFIRELENYYLLSRKKE